MLHATAASSGGVMVPLTVPGAEGVAELLAGGAPPSASDDVLGSVEEPLAAGDCLGDALHAAMAPSAPTSAKRDTWTGRASFMAVV
jgi:hypothetical protein